MKKTKTSNLKKAQPAKKAKLDKKAAPKKAMEARMAAPKKVPQTCTYNFVTLAGTTNEPDVVNGCAFVNGTTGIPVNWLPSTAGNFDDESNCTIWFAPVPTFTAMVPLEEIVPPASPVPAVTLVKVPEDGESETLTPPEDKFKTPLEIGILV